MTTRTISAPGAKGSASRPLPRPLLIALIVLAIGVAAAIAIAVAAGSDDGATDDRNASARIPGYLTDQTSAVAVTGAALPAFASAAPDASVGLAAPRVVASYFDEDRALITPGDGKPKVMLFLAHWCPHCQAEVPALTEWFAANGVPTDVDIIAISTSVDSGAPNYPPSSWLAREDWPTPVLRDSATNELAAAYGLTSFPFLVAIDGDGSVVTRESGEIATDRLASLFETLTG